MATSTTVRRGWVKCYIMNWRGFDVESDNQQFFKIWTLNSKTESNYLDWSEQEKKRQNNESILNAIMKFTSLFRRPPDRDVLIRTVFFKACSLLSEVTFNLLFNCLIQVNIRSFCCGGEAMCFFVFAICLYTARYKEKSLLQVRGWMKPFPSKLHSLRTWNETRPG